MKSCALIAVAFVLSACVSQQTSLHAVGQREAMRLRKSYARWVAERPRKIDLMDVPSSALSQEARVAGFREGSVDSEIVLLYTAQTDNGTAGLIFGSPSAAELEGLKNLGFAVEVTAVRDVFSFRLKAKN